MTYSRNARHRKIQKGAWTPKRRDSSGYAPFWRSVEAEHAKRVELTALAVPVMKREKKAIRDERGGLSKRAFARSRKQVSA